MSVLLYLLSLALVAVLGAAVIRRRWLDRSLFDCVGRIHSDLWIFACLLVALTLVAALLG